MLIKKPIFIVGIAFGGSNILLNLLRSHQDICSPAGETDELFKGKNKGFYNLFPAEPLNNHIIKILHYLPILFSQKQHIFSKKLWKQRKKINEKNKIRIDKVLYYEKIKNINSHYNNYHPNLLKNTPSNDLLNRRGLFKNLSGLVYLSNFFHEMYPDATFIGLVRNSYAVCEGHIRRGASLNKFSKRLNNAYLKLIYDSENISNFNIIRFEDMLEKPLDTLKYIYKIADLDISKVSTIKLQIKKVIDAKGKHKINNKRKIKEIIDYDINEFGNHFIKNVNENQISRLTVEQKKIIEKNCYKSMQYFSYL